MVGSLTLHEAPVIAIRIVCSSLLALTLGCGIPHRPIEFPPRTEAWIAVLSGEMPSPIGDVARHAWIVASLPGHGEGL